MQVKFLRYLTTTLFLLSLFSGCQETTTESEKVFTPSDKVADNDSEKTTSSTTTETAVNEETDKNTTVVDTNTTAIDENITNRDFTAPFITNEMNITINERTLPIFDIQIDDENATIELQGSDAYAFELDGTSLHFKVEPLFEMKEQYHITLLARDEHGNASENTLQINIADVKNDTLAQEALTSTSNILKRAQISNGTIPLIDVLFTVSYASAQAQAASSVMDANNMVSSLLFDENKTIFDSMSEAEQDDLILSVIFENLLYYYKATPISSENPLEVAINSLIDSDIAIDVMRTAMFTILETSQESKKLLDKAIESSIVSDGLVVTLSDQENWNALIVKLVNLLSNSDDIAFAEKFMQWCSIQENMAHFLFSNIDTVLYETISDAMVNSVSAFIASGVGNAPTSSDHPKEYISKTMGELLAHYAAVHLIIPSMTDIDQGNPAHFASLLFNNGNSFAATNGDDDANEALNSKFYYALFSTPYGTQAFVNAMKNMTSVYATAYLDLIFLGLNPIEDAKASIDVGQGYLNIVVITDAIAKGISDYGKESYSAALLDFASIIPESRKDNYTSAIEGAKYNNETGEYSALTSVVQ